MEKLINKEAKTEEKKEKKSSKKRIISGLIGLPIIALILIFANKWIMSIFVAAISVISSYEYFKAFKTNKKANPSEWYGYIISILVIFVNFLDDVALKEVIIALIPISLLVLMIELILSKGNKNITDVAITMLGICYIPIMLMFLNLIRETFLNGKLLIWYVIFASWGSDVFAYFIGKKFGKNHFTKLSPNKTTEGCIAGIVGAVATSIIYTIAINSIFSLSINYFIVSIIIIILSAIGQIGDLAASSIKRHCEIKDFGELIPGHGGMLDRIDSVIFILPFAYILLGLLI